MCKELYSVLCIFRTKVHNIAKSKSLADQAYCVPLEKETVFTKKRSYFLPRKRLKQGNSFILTNVIFIKVTLSYA